MDGPAASTLVYNPRDTRQDPGFQSNEALGPCALFACQCMRGEVGSLGVMSRRPRTPGTLAQYTEGAIPISVAE